MEGVTITLPDEESDDNAGDFLSFLDDDTDDKDNGNIKKIPVEEIKGLFVNSGVDENEIIHLFKMEGFESSIEIHVDNLYEFIWPKVDGKVFRKGKWISATHVEIEVNNDSLAVILTFYISVFLELKRYSVKITIISLFTNK